MLVFVDEPSRWLAETSILIGEQTIRGGRR